MAEQLSLNRAKTAVLIMDYQNRQLSTFSKDFQDELLARANKVLAKARHVIYYQAEKQSWTGIDFTRSQRDES